jgi:alpha-N-arabinofuranosidase
MAALLGGSETFAKYIEHRDRTGAILSRTKQRSRKQMMLSLDELRQHDDAQEELRYWKSVRNPNGFVFDPAESDKHYVRHDPDNWEPAGMRARGSQMLQALTMASTMLDHDQRADRVKIGCLTGGWARWPATDRENVGTPRPASPTPS